MIGEHLTEYDYPYLLDLAMRNVKDDWDKREAALIWDTIAACCYPLSLYVTELYNMLQATYMPTSWGEFAIARAAEQGMTLIAATYALRRADFADAAGQPMEIPVGSRFSSIETTGVPTTFYVKETYRDELDDIVPGAFVLQCEQPGIVGNAYKGRLLAISNITGLATAEMTTVVTPARDEETVDEIKIRYELAQRSRPSGGNIAYYDSETKGLVVNGMAGAVGEVQVYPTWDKSNGNDGAGTVKLSIVSASDYKPVSSDFINDVHDQIDPENAQGQRGVGLGIATIGHKVTVTTPTGVPINVSATVVIKSGFSLGSIKQGIIDEIQAYLLSLRREWGVADVYGNYSLFCFLPQIQAAILRVNGVATANNVTLNGQTNDIAFTQTAQLQQIPINGSITINGTVIYYGA